MYELPPVMKTVQKPHNSPAKAANNPHKNDDIHQTKNNAPQKAVKKDDVNKSDSQNDQDKISDDQVTQQFSDLVSEQETAQPTSIVPQNETMVEPEIQTNQQEEVELTAEPIIAPMIASVQADELANAKLAELNLNEGVDIAAASTTQIDETAQADKATQQPQQAINNATISASTLDGTIEAAPSTADLTIKTASNDNEQTVNPLPTKTVSDIVEKLQNLTNEDLEKAGIKPQQMDKIFSQIDGMSADIKDNGADTKIKNLMAELSALLDQNDTTNEGLEKIFTKLRQILSANQNNAEAEAMVEGQTEDVTVDNKLANNIVKTAKQSETTKNQTPDAASQAMQAQIQPEASKYAGRYNKTENAETAPLNDNTDEATSQNQSTAAYNDTKSNTSQVKDDANSMSALDKINAKSPMDFLNQLQNSTNNQPLDSNSQENVVNIKLAMQNGKLAQNLPLNSMAFQMSKQFNKGNSEFQIRLDPAELGRINIKLTLKQGGDVKAHMVTERNDVFELLQRDSRALEKALNDAGFDGQNVEVEVSLDQNAQNGGTFAENFFDQPTNDNNNSENNSTIDEETVQLVASHIPLHVTSTGIDRKI